ncbi:hypothetical protein GBAR_LOCUS11729 [Geodia barretti]|uniref:Uncharacterized protein n=1 Tax=Geodia barretti TaxID=519541 RepID=A0AA35RYX7_GEOBA|nr:hypothetical protein GBAR_LOCUS11729 [Geodia barretti]
MIVWCHPQKQMDKENCQLSLGLEQLVVLSAELKELKETVTTLKQGSILSQSSKRIPPSLSVAVKAVHDKAPDEMQFDGSKQSVHRYYESRRRLFNDIQPGRLHIARETIKKSRNKAHRKLLYERRKRVLKKEKKRERWTAIDFKYMTEESDGEEQVRQHKLPWRSEVLNRLVKKLDARIEKNEKAGGFKSKDKLQSCLSLLEPPPDAPVQQS